jgi:outer membrane protein OmpA-like peptidoglycan-associated protein
MKSNCNYSIKIITFLLLFVPLQIFSQNILRNRIQVQNVQGKNINGHLEVSFDLLLNGVEVSSDNQLVVSPLIETKAGREYKLHEVIVNGKRRNNLYKRSLRLNDLEEDEMAYIVLKADNQVIYRTIPYKVQIPQEADMDNAALYLVADLCGCGGSEKDHFKKLIADPLIQPDCWDYIPSVNFIVPPKEKIKERSQIGEAYLVFEQSKWTILPNRFNNQGELEKIEKSLAYINEESTAVITGISIKAYASPEGTYEENLALSQSRAKSLLDYVRQHYGLPASIHVFSEGYGEDWDGLVEKIKADSKIENKEQVLQIIRTVGIFDGREKQLMDLSGGRPYLYMLDNLFPRLRRSEYRIEYTVPEFEPEKATILLNTKPEMLSLAEMYQIANTYEKGSEPFNEVFAIARKIYPNDKTANLNAAAVAILDGNHAYAKEILEQYKTEAEAWNNLGVVYMRASQFNEAETYLQKAKNHGTSEADRNLKILKELTEGRRK